MKSTSDIKPNHCTFEHYPLGGYILWLRENFREITEPDEKMSEPHTSWVYDEYTMLVPTPLTDEFIEEHFDEYVSEARAKEASNIDDRLTAAEAAITDIAEMLGEITG